jgi:NADH-quinone oxidoreductase subunit B
MLLQRAVGQERRPLSWLVGPQGVERARMPSQRDAKRQERQLLTDLRPPNKV